MSRSELPENAILEVAAAINRKVNKTPNLSSPLTVEGDTRTPHYFEIVPFDEIDKSERTFFAIDGSTNNQEFYNGVCVGLYTAGYIGYQSGKQLKLNHLDDPVINGKSYFPSNLIITCDDDKDSIFDELLSLAPVHKLLQFFGAEDWSGWGQDLKSVKQAVCKNTSTLFSFCQTILEWSVVLEIAESPEAKRGDFILRDGNLRPLDIKQRYVRELGRLLHDKEITLVAVTKNSPIKLQLSSTFRNIDNYLQTDLKYKFSFAETEERKRKICCWFEVNDFDLAEAYGEGSLIIRKGIAAGRGFGLYFAARLDYVEKLQNYDWVVVDLNIFDAIPTIRAEMSPFDVGREKRDIERLKSTFKELTRLTQEHYLLGYPYPLADVHNFVTLKSNFQKEIVNRVKMALYETAHMEHVDIENLFLDIHQRF
jgi:hypothetical protein